MFAVDCVIKSHSQTTSAFTFGSREDFIAFVDEITLGAATLDKSSLILKFQVLNGKILN